MRGDAQAGVADNTGEAYIQSVQLQKKPQPVKGVALTGMTQSKSVQDFNSKDIIQSSTKLQAAIKMKEALKHLPPVHHEVKLDDIPSFPL